MRTAALNLWQTDRALQLDEVEAHCAALTATNPPDSLSLEESLRGLVMHLGAHLQGFCRNLYIECSNFWISNIPPGMRAAANSQFLAQLALDKGNPSYENIRRDFDRFGFAIDLQAVRHNGPQCVTDLGHLNEWRNRAAHQSVQPLRGGIPPVLALPLIQTWRGSCVSLTD